MSTLNLEIRQTLNPSDIFEVPPGWLPDISPFMPRATTARRLSKDGEDLVGDQKANARDINFTFKQAEETNASYRQILNRFVGFMQPENGPFHLVWTDESLRTRVALQMAMDKPHAGGTEYRIGTNQVVMKMLDAFWEDLDAVSADSPTGGLANDETMTVNNDSYFIAYPAITINTDDDCNQFTLANETNGGAITLASNAFLSSTTFYLDSVNGTVYLDDLEHSAAVADGSGLLFFSPGVNTLRVTNPAGTVLTLAIDFRRRYPF